jgi:pyruvate formate lyase activating enzyme
MTAPTTHPPVARYWHVLDDQEIECDLCPRHCRMREGQVGFCEVRAYEAGRLVSSSYGRGTGFHLDTMEKAGLHHFMPGAGVLSFGTLGCNLGCRYCTNPLVHPPEGARIVQQWASPTFITQAAGHLGARGVGFGGNDPVVFEEFAVDVARAAHEAGLLVVARTAGYVEAAPRGELFGMLDAVSLELQAFRDDFYERACMARLGPVLETAAWVKDHTRAWLELSYRLVPGENDSAREIDDFTSWVAGGLGRDVPVHFTTSAAEAAWGRGRISLEQARALALANGLRYVYVRSGLDPWGPTDCAACGARLVERAAGRITGWGLDEKDCCQCCGTACPGVFGPPPELDLAAAREPSGLAPVSC